MGNKKFALTALVFILVASMSACATDASNTRSISPSTSSNLPIPSAGNQTIQVIAQAVPVWEQVNSNGFGDPQTGEVTALETFDSYLYAGTYNPIDPAPLYDGAQIFRSPDGVTWSPVTQPGFGNTHDIAPPAILDFVVFNNQLYASTGRGNASQIWRSSNGTTWAPMDVTGFSDPDNVDITALAVYNGMIYAGVRNQVTGAQIWRSFTGDNNTWTQVAPTVPGTIPASVTGLATFAFDGGLYAAVESEEGPAQIWRSYGGSWEVIINDGFGDNNTLSTGGLAEFGGYLYIGAGNIADGAQLWRTNDGSVWEQAISPGFGDSNNQKVESVFVFQNQLYTSVQNTATGMEIWRSADGILWEQANTDGFGDSNNTGTNFGNATAEFMTQLYVGTLNMVDGGELWRTQQQLPDTPTSTPTNTSTPTSTNTLTFTPTNTATNTPSNTPTYTSTSTSTSTMTYTSTASYTPTNTATSTLTFTSTASNTPSRTATSTSTDIATSTPTFTPTASNTPTNTPTSTPTPLPNTSGKVTGGGNIDLTDGKITFGFVVHYSDGDSNPSGNLTFKDHGSNLDFKATSFNLLFIQGSHTLITGFASVNDQSDLPFVLNLDDYGEPGRSDTFWIHIADLDGYISGGTLSGGNITIHK